MNVTLPQHQQKCTTHAFSPVPFYSTSHAPFIHRMRPCVCTIVHCEEKTISKIRRRISSSYHWLGTWNSKVKQKNMYQVLALDLKRPFVYTVKGQRVCVVMPSAATTTLLPTHSILNYSNSTSKHRRRPLLVTDTNPPPSFLLNPTTTSPAFTTTLPSPSP